MAKVLRILSPVKNNVVDGASLALGANVADAVLVDEYGAVEWRVVCARSDGERVKVVVDAVHNGTASADATDGAYETSGGATTGGAEQQVSFSVALTGTGVTQALQLIVTTTGGTWTVFVHRGPIVGSGA